MAILQSSGNFRFTTQNDAKLPVSRHMCFDFGSQSVPFPAEVVANYVMLFAQTLTTE